MAIHKSRDNHYLKLFLKAVYKGNMLHFRLFKILTHIHASIYIYVHTRKYVYTYIDRLECKPVCEHKLF